jgi:prepilin-type N-terminal cleavage/methylation domain-containing protein
MNYPNRQAGFTLLELLITLTILAMIMGIVYGGMRLGNRAWLAGESRIERNQRIRLVLNQLAEEIRSAYSIKMKGETVDDKYQAFWGEPNKISFVTVTAGLMSEPLENKLRAVSYYVETGRGLVMKETALNFDDFFNQLDTQEAIILDPEVAEISFRYYYMPDDQGEDSTEKKGIWATEWDPKDKENKLLNEGDEDYSKEPITARQLPNAVEITLTMQPEREGEQPKVIPPLITPIFWGQEIKIESGNLS